MAAVASFSYKIGGGLIFQQNWRRWQGFADLATLLAAVLTWSGYWVKSLRIRGLQNSSARTCESNKGVFSNLA